MQLKFKLIVNADEEMGFDSVEVIQDHIEEAIRNAGDAGFSVKLTMIDDKCENCGGTAWVHDSNLNRIVACYECNPEGEIPSATKD